MSGDRSTAPSDSLERLSRMLERAGFPHTIARGYAALTLAEGEGLSTSGVGRCAWCVACVELVVALGITAVLGAVGVDVPPGLAGQPRMRGGRNGPMHIHR